MMLMGSMLLSSERINPHQLTTMPTILTITTTVVRSRYSLDKPIAGDHFCNSFDKNKVNLNFIYDTNADLNFLQVGFKILINLIPG